MFNRLLHSFGHAAVWGPGMGGLTFVGLGVEAFARHHDGWGVGLFGAGGILGAIGVAAFVASTIKGPPAERKSATSARITGGQQATTNTGAVAARDSAVAIGNMTVGRIMAGAATETSTLKPLSQWFVANEDLTRGVLVGKIWWRFLGWKCYRTTNLPALSMRPDCPEHHAEFLVRSDTGAFVPVQFGNGLGTYQSRIMRCSATSHIVTLDDLWETVWNEAMLNLERVAAEQRWRLAPRDTNPNEAGGFFV
jgi:hypothetical protein